MLLYKENTLNLDEVFKVLLGSTLALLGGIISYIATSREYTWLGLIVKGVSSGFVGLLSGLLGIYLEVPESLLFFICGTFGYLGSEVSISLLKKYLENKLKLQ